MTGWNLRYLLLVNKLRDLEWRGDKPPMTSSFRGLELAGEAGEACNIVKKLERERLGWEGSRATKEQLAEELADVIICCSLLALDYDIDLMTAVPEKFNKTSEARKLRTRM